MKEDPKSHCLYINCGSIDILTWIFVHNMWFQKDIFSYGNIKLGHNLNIEVVCWTNLLWFLKQTITENITSK
jgi:hypothetical protein